MVEISNAELALLKNTLVAIRITVSRLGKQSKEIQQIIDRIGEAERLISSNLDIKSRFTR